VMKSTAGHLGAPTARIYRAGQTCEVQPATASIRRALRTIVHKTIPLADKTLPVHAIPIPLYEELQVAGKPALACWAGWEPVIRKLLLADGYEMETFGNSRPALPRPEDGRLLQFAVIDHALLACVHQQERGLIRYAADLVDPVHLVAQIALAWPRQRIAVLVTRIKEGRQIRDRLRRYGIDAVAVNSENMPPEVGPVAVCTPAGLSHLPVRVEWLDIVLIMDAREITSRIGLECIGFAWRARLFGLLAREERPAPLERDLMTGLFGFHEVTIPRHGHRERRVEVLRYPVRGGPRLPNRLDVLAVKRVGLWQHALRNRKIARLVCALREYRVDHIQKMFPVYARGLMHASRQGVIVLVENLEHALALSCRLPDWPILTGVEVCLHGLPAEQAPRIRPASPLGEAHPLYAIVTASGLGTLDVSAVGVVVRADGGAGLPALLGLSFVVSSTDPPPPVLLIDFCDRHLPLLRRWSRWREKAYAERGWFAPGVDPVQGRVEQFLAIRAGGSSR
jgi:hypothetical protein